MKNEKDEIIYVGKAINSKNRVRSYFQKTASQNFKTRQLVKAIRDIDWIVVGSELEALILELNLIKQHRPFYNVKLKDDKRYPYIKVSWADPFPKLTVTRQMDRRIQVFWTIHIRLGSASDPGRVAKDIPCTELQSTYHGQRHPSLFVL